MTLAVASLVVGAFQENVYLVVDQATNRAVLVDPGAEPERVARMVRESGATLDAIWITHAHLDHIGAVAGIKRTWNVPVLCHPLDHVVWKRAAEAAAGYGVAFEQPAAPDAELADGDQLSIGEARFAVMHLPGHAPGHVAFVGDEIVLGGDLLFAGSIGRTDLPYADGEAMQRSLERVLTLRDDLLVLPGHGPATTIGDERATNPFLTGLARPIRR